MALFMVVHTPALQEATQEALLNLMQVVARTNVPETRWLSSWLTADASRMFCLWEAPDEAAIRRALGMGLRFNPIELAWEVLAIDPAQFRQDSAVAE